MAFIKSTLNYSFHLVIKYLKSFLFVAILNILVSLIFILLLLLVPPILGKSTFFAQNSFLQILDLLLIFFYCIFLGIGYLISINLLNYYLILKIIGEESGIKTTNNTIIQYSLKRMYPTLTVGLLAGFLTSAGMILFIIPGIIFYYTYFFSSYFVLINGDSPSQSLKSSAALTKGYKWKLFFITIFYNLIPLFIFFVIDFLFSIFVPISKISIATSIQSLVVLALVNQITRYLFIPLIMVFGSVLNTAIWIRLNNNEY